mgnify:CR=1 FL=1
MQGRIREESLSFPNDRRSARRFPIKLNIKFTGLLQDTNEEGSGTTINIGSKGMMFTTEAPVAVSSWLGFLIDWPVGPRAETVKLAARGRVVHSSQGRIGVALNWHEFRRQEPGPRTTSIAAQNEGSF